MVKVVYAFIGVKLLGSHLIGKNIYTKMIACLYKIQTITSLWVIYVIVYGHYFQTLSFLKPLGQLLPKYRWSINRSWGLKVNRLIGISVSHDQDGAMPYSMVTSKMFVYRSKRPIILWLGM